MYIEGRNGKVIPVDSMKVYMESIGIAPLILNLGVKMEVSGQHSVLSFPWVLMAVPH
jgi:hypothetical protein